MSDCPILYENFAITFYGENPEDDSYNAATLVERVRKRGV